MMSALSVVFLFFGGLTGMLELTGVVISSIIIFVVYEELKYSAFGVYLVTAVIAFFIPFVGTTIAFEYLIFAIYPILKPLFDRLPRGAREVVKLLFMSASFVGLTLLLHFVLGMPEVWYINVIFCVSGIAIYYLFDIALFRFTTYYRLVLRRKLGVDKFFK